MSLYSDKLENIIEALQINNINKETQNKKKVNLNSHSREFKNIQFRSNMYKNSQVKKQEKENVVKGIQIKEYHDKDIYNIYNRPWNKLENGFKKNRIVRFIEKEMKEKKLTLSQKDKLKSILYDAIDNKYLNNNDLDYDICEGIIKTINILNYNIDNGCYTIIKKETKKKIKTVTNNDINLLSILKKKTDSNRIKIDSEQKHINENFNSF